MTLGLLFVRIFTEIWGRWQVYIKKEYSGPSQKRQLSLFLVFLPYLSIAHRMHHYTTILCSYLVVYHHLFSY